MYDDRSWKKSRALRGLAAAALVIGFAAVNADAGVRLKATLAPTVVNPSAQGKAAVAVSGRGHKRKGKLNLSARHLAPRSTFTVRVAGVPIGTFTTSGGGSGHARFSTAPRRNEQPLGVDPRGQRLVVADDEGEDELETDVPDDTQDPCCCSDEDGDGTEDGEEVSEPECQGTVAGALSCLPDPCNEDGEEIRCCLTDEDGAECDLTTATECGDHHGVNLGAGSCDPNPCAPVVPPTVTRCCVADEDEHEGQGAHLECEHLTAPHCTEEGGTDAGPGSCEPNPCAGSPSPAFLDGGSALF